MTSRKSDTDRSRRADNRAHDSSARRERPPMDRWSPANVLEIPPPKDGYSHRWIAEYVNGTFNPLRVNQALSEGYERVGIDALPDDFIVDEDSSDGYARSGGFILMKFPDEFARQRREHYLKQSMSRLNGANQLQGVAGRNTFEEDRGTRTLEGAEAGRQLAQMSQR